MKIAGYWAFILLLIGLSACVKETSFESGNSLINFSEGTLKDSLGDCKGIVVKGNYAADSVLTDSNYLLVQVTIVKSGKYTIASDTVNGFWFRDSGYATAGTTTLKIRGYGKPILPLNTNFILSYNLSVCLFTCTLVPTATPLPIIRDYFPTTVGSNWAYNVAGFTDTLHVSASAKDTIIGGNSYRVFYGGRGVVKDTAFYRKNGNEYIRWDALDLNSGRMPLLFLKDDQPLLHTWESNFANSVYLGVPTEVKMKYTLLAVHTPYTVNGNTFDSVIHVRNDLQYKILGNYQTIQTINTYFAKNVGLIEFTIPGVYSQTIRRWRVY